MKKILLSYIQSCHRFNKGNFGLNSFFFLTFLMMSLSGFAQQDDHDINAGQDVILECGESCTDLTATYLYTGQTDQYSVSSIPYDPPFPYTGLANPVSVGIDDVWSQGITLPFEFCYYGELYTRAQVGSNGIISFNSHPPLQAGGCSYTLGANEYLPGGVSHKNAIMLFHDINPVYGNNEIGWELLGQAPYRALVVSFYNVPYYSGSNGNNTATSTFQMVLYETTNAIEIYIESKPNPNGIVTGPINGGRAVLGIHDKTGTKAETAPGRNTGVWAATNEAWRFTPNGDPNVEFAWLDADGNVIGTDTTINVCPTEDVTTYTAQAIYMNCNGDQIIVTDDVTVTLSPSDFDITIDLGPDVVVCDDISYEIVPEIEGDTTGSTFLWSPGGETTPTITVTSSGIYTLDISKEGCTASSSVRVDFSESPIIDLGPDIDTCFEQQIILDATPSNYNASDCQFEWKLNGNIIPGETDATLEITETGTYEVSVTAEGCTTTDEIIVTTNAGQIDLGGDQDLCDAENYEITVEFIIGDPNDATFLWNTGETTQSIVVTESGTYSVEVMIDSCKLNSEVTINFFDTPNIDLGEDIETCFIDPVILDATPSNYDDPMDVTYEWSLNGTVMAGETNPTLNVTNTGTYSVTVSMGGCVAIAEINVGLGNVDFDLGADIETCFDQPIVLDATPTNFDVSEVIFEWSFNGNVLAGEANATLEVTEIGTYGVTVSVGSCSTIDSIEILPKGDLEVSIIEGDFEVCPNEPRTLTATTSEEGVTYQWSLNGSEIAGETASTIEINIAPGTVGTQTYSVVMSAGGCSGTDSVDIRLYTIGNCVISQGLSPNGDGFNDTLDLTFLNDRTGIKKLQIFNRLGTLVFEKINYINEWAGQTNGGDDLPTGTYFYVIDLNGNDAVYGNQHTGWIYLNQKAN